MQTPLFDLQNDINHLNQILTESTLVKKSIPYRKKNSSSIKQEQINPEIEQSINKIQKILHENPTLMSDPSLVDSVLNVGQNCLIVCSQQPWDVFSRIDQVVEKMHNTVIQNVLKQENYNHLSLEEGLRKLEKTVQNPRARKGVETASRKFQLRADKFRNHSAYQKITSEKIKYLWPLCDSGVYFISSEKSISQMTLHYKLNEEMIPLSLTVTLDGRLACAVGSKSFSSDTMEGLIEQLQAEKVIPSDLKMVPIGKARGQPEFETAATKIQSAFRGWKTRQVVVLPNQIIPFLSRFLVNDTSLTDLAKGISREINEMALNPKKYKGKMIRLEKLTKIYSFPIIDKMRSGQTEFKLNFDCWLEMPPDGKTIKLLIKPTSSVLGEGTNKVNYRAQSFEIALRLQQGQRGMSHHRKIVIVGKQQNVIKEGMNIHRLILAKVDKKAKMTSLPRELHSNPLELEQDWYNSDFLQVISTSQMPLDFNSNPVNVTLLEKLMILKDAAVSVELIHQAGFIHRDLKPNNILVNASFEGYLNDFDFACNPGVVKGYKGNYHYWDLSTKHGWNIPFCDVYGLGMILGETLIPHFLVKIGIMPWILTDSKDKQAALNEAVATYAKNYLNRIPSLSFLAGGLSPTRSSNFTKMSIDNYLKSYEHVLQDEQKEALETLKNELNAVEAAFNYFADIVKTDVEIYRFILNNPDVQKWLASEKKIDRTKAIKRLETQFPLFSTNQFLEKLTAIEQMLQK